jgi:putative transposase
MLIDAVRAEITALPSYGYRRAGELVNRTRYLIGLGPVNHKRIYRVMKEQQLLLPKASKRPVRSRPHEGKVAVSASDVRWCSDGFEIACENGQVVTGTFTKDCCDREIIARHRQGVSISELARLYNVSRISIARVAKPKEESRA